MSETPNVQYVKVEKRGNLAEIKLAFEEGKNLFGFPLVEKLKEELNRLKEEKDIKAVILSSELENLFSAGYDLAYIQRLQELGVNENIVDVTHLAELYLTVLQYPKLILGKVEGKVQAPATNLLALCDFVFALKGVTWNFLEPKLGFVPGINIVLFSQLYSTKTIRKLFFRGEWTSEELLSLGITDFVYDNSEALDKGIKEYIDNFLNGETASALQLIKRLSLDVHYIADSNYAVQLGVKTEARSRLSAEAKLMTMLLLEKEN